MRTSDGTGQTRTSERRRATRSAQWAAARFEQCASYALWPALIKVRPGPDTLFVFPVWAS